MYLARSSSLKPNFFWQSIAVANSDRRETLLSGVPSGRVASWEFPGINPWAGLCFFGRFGP